MRSEVRIASEEAYLRWRRALAEWEKDCPVAVTDDVRIAFLEGWRLSLLCYANQVQDILDGREPQRTPQQ